MLAAAPFVALSRSGREVESRRWIVTGEPVARLEGLDQAMRRFMQAGRIRSGALAVARAGNLIFEHTYSFAEPHLPRLEAESPFRHASVSKAFTAALIYELVAAGELDLDARVFPLLGLTRPALASQQRDRRLDTITLRDLVEHRGGFDAQVANFDPLFRMRDVARRLGLHAGPTKHDIARYMAGEPLQFPPGTRSRYSNFGYLLLGLAAERVTQSDYLAAVRTRVTGSLGADAVFVARTRQDQRLAGEGFYDQAGTGLTPEFPDRPVRLPLPYGGGGFLTESMDAAAGLAASAGTVARLIGRYAVWGFGRRRDGETAARDGVMSGTTSCAISRADGLDVCLVINTKSLAINAITLEVTRVLDAAALA